MGKRTAIETAISLFKKSIVSDYVHLCINEGIAPKDAYLQLEKKLAEAKKQRSDSKIEPIEA